MKIDRSCTFTFTWRRSAFVKISFIMITFSGCFSNASVSEFNRSTKLPYPHSNLFAKKHMRVIDTISQSGALYFYDSALILIMTTTKSSFDTLLCFECLLTAVSKERGIKNANALEKTRFNFLIHQVVKLHTHKFESQP